MNPNNLPPKQAKSTATTCPLEFLCSNIKGNFWLKKDRQDSKVGSDVPESLIAGYARDTVEKMHRQTYMTHEQSRLAQPKTKKGRKQRPTLCSVQVQSIQLRVIWQKGKVICTPPPPRPPTKKKKVKQNGKGNNNTKNFQFFLLNNYH